MEGAAEGGCHKRGCVGGWRRDEAIAYLEAFYPFHPRLGACHCACVCVAMTCVSSAAIAPACACACLLFSATACASTPMLLQARPTCTAIHTTSRPCPTKVSLSTVKPLSPEPEPLHRAFKKMRPSKVTTKCTNANKATKNVSALNSAATATAPCWSLPGCQVETRALG